MASPVTLALSFRSFFTLLSRVLDTDFLSQPFFAPLPPLPSSRATLAFVCALAKVSNTLSSRMLRLRNPRSRSHSLSLSLTLAFVCALAKHTTHTRFDSSFVLERLRRVSHRRQSMALSSGQEKNPFPTVAARLKAASERRGAVHRGESHHRESIVP